MNANDTQPGQRWRVLTWHVHGNYLYALTQVPCEFIVPVRPGRAGYSPLGSKIPWGANVREVPADRIHEIPVDCILYQSPENLADAATLLSPQQQRLPCAFLEHNPPQQHPTDAVHPFRHPGGVLVHVTPYNAQMWDHSADVTQRVIEHGIVPPRARYLGELARGIVVVNNIARRGRRMGADLHLHMARQVPLDLIGMDSERCGGLGEVPNMDVAAFMSHYRFFFSPVRYGSLGLALLEAMMCGVPVVGFGGTELPAVIHSGVDGYVDNRPERLAQVCRQLIAEPELARQWGEAGRRLAMSRYHIDRFVDDWRELFDALMEER